MKQYLAASLLAADRPGLVHEITHAIHECGAAVVNSHVGALGADYGLLLLISGNWHALARVESELARLAAGGTLSMHLRRTDEAALRTDRLPYSIDIVSADQPGIVDGVAGFLAARGIEIAEGTTRVYPAPHTAAPMIAVQLTIQVPAKLALSQLREEFLDFCDSLNLDAILEPVKT